MKNIILFITSLSSGGAEHQLVNLADFLHEQQYKVSIVTFSDIPNHYSVSEGIDQIKLGQGRGKSYKFWCIFKYFLLLKNDRVVISFGQRENFLCILPLLFNWGPKLIAGERNTTYKASTLDKILIKYLYYRASYVVPNSHTQGEYLMKKNRHLQNRVKVITNYTDLNKYKVGTFNANNKRKIGVFCRYNYQKNIERFSYALKLLKEQVGSVFKVEWFGNKYGVSGDIEPLYSKASKLIEEYGISDVFSLYDKITNVQERMLQYDAICLPSLYEGFSNTLSEAICCGKLCIASSVSDNPIMVEDGVNGFLFNPTKAEDICNAFIRYFSTSIEDCKQMSMLSRRKAENLFDKSAFVNNYINLIEK